MAGFNTIRTYNYNRSLESLRNKVDQKIYQKRMQIIQERKRAKSVRSLMDIFFNAEARERLGGDNWFDTTIKATGEWFNHNFIEWGRNPVNALLNNLGAIGDDLDYAANLIKAPLIAVAKGEDVGERLTDAYGLGDKGRITQSMSDLREALGADNPGAEIGATTGFGALTGAEIGSKGGLLGALIGALVGTGVGLINSSIDVGVRESGTDNGFLKGTQTVCNTISDMMMEYSADPANLFGAIGNVSEFNKTKSIMDNLAKNDPASLNNFKSSLKGERAFKSEEVLANAYNRAAQLAQEPIKKGKNTIVRTAEQQRKFVERRMKNVIHAYMNGDKKAFNKCLIETGIGKYLSDDPKVLEQQIEGMYKVFRHDANMSAIGRFGAFVNNYDAKFAHLLYKGTVPGLTITTAKKAFMKAHKEWETALLETAKKFETGEITTETTSRYPLLQRAAAQHYYKLFDSFDDLKGKYIIKDGMTQEQLSESYKVMSDRIAYFNANGKYREAKILHGLRNQIVLDNGFKQIKLGDAEYSLKALIKNNAGDIELTREEIDKHISKILDLFYFEDGIKYFEALAFNPATFKGDFKLMTSYVEDIIHFANETIMVNPNRKYAEQIDKLAKTTFKWDALNNNVVKFYNDKLHDLVYTALENNKFITTDEDKQRLFIRDMYDLLNNRDLSDEQIKRINDYFNAYLDDNNNYYYEASPFVGIGAYDPNYLVQYQDLYKEAREGMRLRNRYAAYSKAIDNSEEITKAALARKITVESMLSKDNTVLTDIKNIRIQEAYNKAAEELLEKGRIASETLNKIVKDFELTIKQVNDDLDVSKYNSLDIINMNSNAVSAGSTKLSNIISRSRIKKPKNIESITSAEWFLNEYKSKLAIGKSIYSNPSFKPNGVRKQINLAREYLSKNADLQFYIKMLETNFNKKKNRPLLKSMSNNVIKYILGITDKLNDDILNKINKIKGFNYNEFIKELDSFREVVGKDSQWLYNSLTKSFGSSFVSGNGIIEDTKKIFDILDFATEKGKDAFGVTYGVNLINGSFVDNLIQQGVFNDTITELVDSVITPKDLKNLYNQVFKELQVSDTVRIAIADSFNRLYAKRAKLIEDINSFENDANISKAKANKINKLNNKYTNKLMELRNQKKKLENIYNERIKNAPKLNPAEFGFAPELTGEEQRILDEFNRLNEEDKIISKLESRKNYYTSLHKETGKKIYPTYEDAQLLKESAKIKLNRTKQEILNYNTKIRDEAKNIINSHKNTPKNLEEYIKEKVKLHNTEEEILKNTTVYEYDPYNLINDLEAKPLLDYNAKIKEIENYELETKLIKQDIDSIDFKIKNSTSNWNNEIDAINKLSAKDLQLESIRTFQKETDDLYSKLNTLTKGMFMTNLDPKDLWSDKKSYNNVIEAINNFFKIQWSKEYKADKKELIEALVIKLNNLVIDNKDYKYAKDFIDLFKTDIADITIRNNKFIITYKGVANDFKTTEITPEQFGMFFDNTVGVEKTYWLRNDIIKSSGLDKIDSKIKTTPMKSKTIKNKHQKMTHAYNRLLPALLGEEDRALTDYERTQLVNAVLGYDAVFNKVDNVLNSSLKDLGDEVSPARVGSCAVDTKVNNLSLIGHYYDNYRDGRTGYRAIKLDNELLWEEPYMFSIVSENGRMIKKNTDIFTLRNTDNDIVFKSKLNYVIADNETQPIIGNDLSKADLLQTTFRPKGQIATNFMIYHEDLNNSYRGVNNELLDAAFVNGNYLSKGGILIEETDKYIQYMLDGKIYNLYKTPEYAAQAMFEYCRKNGIIDENGILRFTGHNSSGFDAEVLLRFFDKHLPGQVKGVDSVDTLALGRAVMLSEWVDNPNDFVFKDDESATLGNLYEHWFGNDGDLANAHNADADTLMTERVLNHIESKIGESPSAFFNKYLTNAIEIPENISTEFNKITEYVRNISIKDMVDINEHLLKKELHQTVNEDFISSIREDMQETLNNLNDEFSKIKTYNDLIKFQKDFNNFITEYEIYTDDLPINTDIIFEYIDDITDTRNKKLNLLWGDSQVRLKSNRDANNAMLLDGFADVNSRDMPNALNELMFIVKNANNIKELDKWDSHNLTKIGFIAKSLLKQVDYDLDKFYEDNPLLKQLVGYTNRINAFAKFSVEWQTIIDDVVADASIKNPEMVPTLESYLEAIRRDIFGYGTNKHNLSIEGYLKEMLKYAPDKSDASALSAYFHELLESRTIINPDYLERFDEATQDRITKLINNYINDCLDNIGDYTLSAGRKSYALTILQPTPDADYISLIRHALGDTDPRGILGNYQSRIQPVIAKTPEIARQMQRSDQEDGLIEPIEALRGNLSRIDDINEYLEDTKINRAALEQMNGMNISQINSLRNTCSVVSADNYVDEQKIILEDRNYIYDAFDIKYDAMSMGPSTYRNVESKFYKTTERIKDTFLVNSYQMQDAADIASLTDDATYTIQKQVFAEYWNDSIKSKDEQELYDDFLKQIVNYKDKAHQYDPKKVAEIEQSVKAYFGAIKMYGMSGMGEVVNAKSYKPLTLQENLINHTTRYAEESNRMLNELFTNEFGYVNYALMAKYIQSNPYMKVVAMIPSDRFNNVSKKEKIDYQVSAEFVDTTFKSSDELKAMLTHTPETDGIRYFVVDKHNLMTLKQMVGQTTSHKTYTNRQIFKNNPVMEKMMHFRDIVAKYVLLPTKILGLQNIGFTTTNAAEGFMKALVATEGSKLKTVRKYKEAIQLHRRWNEVTAQIAKATQGSPFYRTKNQWDAMLKELENSKLLFGNKDIATIKSLIANKNIKKLKELMPSVEDFKKGLLDDTKVQNILSHEKRELLQRYKILWGKTDDEQKERIIKLVQRYVDTQEAYNEIISNKEFTKEQFDFVNEFINSPAAAAEMQSIKKAEKLNLIGNKKIYKNGKEEVKENAIDRFYKKFLFSDWGLDNPMKVITPYYNLSLNSDIETVNRLALHMSLLDDGFRHSESYNRILESFFNYGDKTEGELLAELFFPFISFPLRTTLFWDQMLDEHPQMIKIFADLVLTNWGKDAQNQYNQTGITKGGLKISPNLSMESGSSFLDSLVFGGNALNVLRTRKLNPLLGPLVEGATQLATGEANWNYRLSRLPIVSKIMYGMDLSKNLSKGKVALYDIAPSIFHKVYKDNTYYFNNQRQYQYKSIYSRLYTATGYNRWNAKTAKGRVNAVKNLYGIK